MTTHLDRVVYTAPWLSLGLLGCRDQVEHGTICSCNEEEPSNDEEQDVDTKHDLPPCGLWLVGVEPVVVDPHHGVWDHTNKRTDKRTDETDEGAKDGNGGRNDVTDDYGAEYTAEPGDPVAGGVVVQVVGAVEDTDKDVLACQVGEDGKTGEESRNGEAVADLLEQSACCTESWGGNVLSCVVVYDRANDEVDAGDEGDGSDHGPGVGAGVAHLGHDTEADY